jgi:hypothetical protein
MADKAGVRIHLRAAGDNCIELFAETMSLGVNEFHLSKSLSDTLQRVLTEHAEIEGKRAPVMTRDQINKVFSSKGAYN